MVLFGFWCLDALRLGFVCWWLCGRVFAFDFGFGFVGELLDVGRLGALGLVYVLLAVLCTCG